MIWEENGFYSHLLGGELQVGECDSKKVGRLREKDGWEG